MSNMSQGYKLYYNLAERNKTKILAACKQAELRAGPAQFELLVPRHLVLEKLGFKHLRGGV